MTAEIAVLNKSGVALAADSAVSIVTSGNTKIYNTNKLFMLSKFHPVGVMIYGGAELMGVPWESIIKRYRKLLTDKSFGTLEEYGRDFLTFLNNNQFLFPPDEQENYVYGITLSYFARVKKAIDESVEEVAHKGVKISAKDIALIVSTTIQASLDSIISLPRLQTLPVKFESHLLNQYYKIIDQAIDDIFDKYGLSKFARKQLRRISVGLFVNDTFGRLLSVSGIVIAGFGEDELYPGIISYEMNGVVGNTLKYKEGIKTQIEANNTAALLPFAQGEMVISFMEGVAPAYKETLASYLREIFDKYPEQIVKKFTHLTSKEKAELAKELKKAGEDLSSSFWDNVGNWATQNNVTPILNTVAVLPIEELASMAESLVNLTSFKRRVTLVAETVGGPIDVAVISKGDGFVWIKRKHYFEAAANPHFFKNYYR